MSSWPDIPTEPAKGISFFTPAQSPTAGTARNPQTSGKPIPKLFTPLTIRGKTFHNRIGLSAMGLCSADDGHMTPWHFAHYGAIAQRGPGLMIIESCNILPTARLTAGCAGLWKDSQIKPMADIIEFAHSQGQFIGVQLGHAGRKASAVPPWLGGGVATDAVGGWVDEVKGPSAVPFLSGHSLTPAEMSLEDIEEVKGAWAAATRRAVEAGADFIEVHGAHGYLISSFMSPGSNRRGDGYGGTFENRIRLALELVQITRDVVGEGIPVFFRVSGTDWVDLDLAVDGGEDVRWTLEDTLEFARALVAQGAADLIDVSSGGMDSAQKIQAGVAFQAPLAAAVKKVVGDKMYVAAVGMINNGGVAEELLNDGSADIILCGRGFLRDPGLVWRFAKDLDVEISMASQIRWGFQASRTEGAYLDPNSKKAAIFD
ncbi:NADH-dependent flavin oxidoreductase [Aspergillus californicus]